MDRSEAKNSNLKRLGYVVALGCVFVGAQLAIAKSSSVTCNDIVSDWQGGLTAWGQRKASRTSVKLIETFGSVSNVDVSEALELMPKGC